MSFITFVLALGMAAAHLLARRLHFLSATPRSRWLSGASGVSVAYIFVHILPDLAEHQAALEEAAPLSFVEHHVYLVALVGLSAFYGLERLIKRDDEDGGRNPGVFWLHIASFTVYNTLIGYLLVHRESPGLAPLLYFFIALTLHFLVNDIGLRHDHKGLYDRWGRWILSAAVLLGWLVGVLTEINEAALAVLFAFLGGGVILNVLKEELPEERQSRFSAFALGAAGYTVLLLL